MLNEQSRNNILSQLKSAKEEHSVPICICYKDLTEDELNSEIKNEMFNDAS